MIPVYKPHFNGLEKKYVNECLDSTWISSKGKYIDLFEANFSKFIGAKFSTTTSNGTTALHLAMVALGIKAGDEVIVPTFTYVASVNTILQIGAIPVFVDSDPETLQICTKDAANKITEKTAAIMAVHLYGHPCDMDPLVKLCEENKLFLIEDAAEAFGTQYKGQYAGTFGDVATFSFFGNKTITTGEGGMVVCKSQEVYEKACHIKNQGVSKTKEYWHDDLAFNYRMTNIQAAIGYAQLQTANDVIARKRAIALSYQSNLADLPLSTHKEQPNCFHTYWMCSVILDDAKIREPLRNYLKEHGIDTRPFFPCVNTMPHCSTDDIFESASKISLSGFNLPSYPDLTDEEIKHISEVIRTFFNELSK
ncbi:DegT/DnrJ/EryC1/StrS family aminotransferase [Pseudoalteromonas sp. MMG024]|uniref:DegT/DnrJ/EryC1/StrS family aminotransferase n=1 Tax=Pseudoalteromonas sp. MMG024 TaxID=2909980 RepID=UPI001F2BF951|nr:DegT/DnrJ/EryC1/StrS family aminotransferase [Pseudoalteromonas sp. MMG024]MCF6457541.1 DegT/DnrJ/EryC1/StrS family aminotransferase [Pseudoalteromonas sp. MMG024]